MLPIQIDRLEINGNSSDKDSNKQIDNNKTEDIAIESVHNNNKTSYAVWIETKLRRKQIDCGKQNMKN